MANRIHIGGPDDNSVKSDAPFPVHPNDFTFLAAYVASPNLSLKTVAQLKQIDISRARKLVSSNSGKAFIAWLSGQDPEFLWGLQLAANFIFGIDQNREIAQKIWRIDD